MMPITITTISTSTQRKRGNKVNSVVLIGRLTDKPEVSYTQSQKAICRFTLAVDRQTKSEEAQADFIRIIVWDRQGENAGRYLHKGSKCAVLGRIQTGSYKDREGKTVYTTDVVASRVEFLDSKSDKPADVSDVKAQANDLFGDGVGFTYTDDGIPF